MSTFAQVIILPPSFAFLASFLFGMCWRIHEVITNILTWSYPECKNLSGGSPSPNVQHSVHSTHEAAGTGHAFASSRAIETEVEMGNLPPLTESRFGMVCPLSILGTSWKYGTRRGCPHRKGEPGEKMVRLGKTAHSSSIRAMLSGPATLRHLLPLQPRSICQIPQDVSKRFWIIDEPREDAFKNIKYKNRPVQLVQIVGH